VVEPLAKDLQNFFPRMKGFSSRNLLRMKDFYLSYCENEKLTALLAEISWTHHLVILEKCNGWTYRVLMNQIANKTYEKTFASQNNFAKSLPEKMKPPAILSMKDEYAFGFLELISA
jgi:predicted nuclease of restriction endonuclease-like (RecB) superfamily